jgi:hypothetical protein
MQVYQKLTVKDGWVNGFAHHPGFHGGPLPTSAVMGLIAHTMVRKFPGTDDLFTPGPRGEIARRAIIIRQNGPPDQHF